MQQTQSAFPELTERQVEIVCQVVEEHIASRQPVGSKRLVERSSLRVSSSTVRAELFELERLGLLTHPHTSAGRVPTEAGYRFYAQRLLDRIEPSPASASVLPLDLTAARSEVEAALQATTERLSQVTRLLALVSAPPLQTATVRHVEVLLLQPDVVMVVVITSAGGVAKRVLSFETPVDTGLTNWARQYLNEQLTGVQLGTRTLRQRLDEPSLSPREREFVERIRPVFIELAGLEEQRLFVGGAAGLVEDMRADAYRDLIELLEQRAALLDVLGRSLDPRRPFVRVGDELENPALRDIALVGSGYGLPTRTLGTVSLLGPLRMDYENAIRSVRAAARQLSRFAEEVYGEN